MFGKGRYFGFVGTKLNVAIGVLAGLDFLLFGYDQGVMGGLLALPSFVRKWRRGKNSSPPILTVQKVKIFPEIDMRDESVSGLSASQKNHRSTIQGKW